VEDKPVHQIGDDFHPAKTNQGQTNEYPNSHNLPIIINLNVQEFNTKKTLLEKQEIQ